MKYESHDYDVIVIGAGGAGLRAAIAAAEHGARTALVCKSLLGKAHTVMAEGGAAAALAELVDLAQIVLDRLRERLLRHHSIVGH